MLKGLEVISEMYTVALSRGQLIDPVVTIPVKEGVGETLVVVADVEVVCVGVVEVDKDEVLRCRSVHDIACTCLL